MIRITGHVQNYDWGVPGGLGPWVASAADTTDTTPQAELWFGAHANGPSPLVDGRGTLADHGEVARRLPTLTKILAAAHPLSIQVHPGEEVAQAMYDRQLADSGSPRLLADRRGKTEMLIALEPFSTFCGFADFSVSASLLGRCSEGLAQVVEPLAAGDVLTAIRSTFVVEDSVVLDVRENLLSAAAEAGVGNDHQQVLARVLARYPNDPGIIVAAMLHHVVLGEGQAAYVPTGVVHSYVHGLGVEVMNASDNVLRLGLTTKTVAINEALEAVDEQARPQFLNPVSTSTADGGTYRDYRPTGGPFWVRHVAAGSTTIESAQVVVVVAVRDTAIVQQGEESIHLNVGQAAVCHPDALVSEEPLGRTGSYTITTRGLASITVPTEPDDH